MSIEPHAVISVSTPTIRTARQDKPATLADYLANIARRFPKCVTATGAANPVALAKRENAARRKVNGQSTMAREQPTSGTGLMRTPEAERRRIERLQATLNAKSATARQSLWTALSRPMTITDLERETGIGYHSIKGYLAEWSMQGRVSRTKVQRVAIWERCQEAAE